MKLTACKLLVPSLAIALLLPACRDEEQIQRLEQLEQENADHRAEIESLNSRIESIEGQRNKLRDERDEARREASRAKDQLGVAQRKLESVTKNEQRETARNKARQNPLDESKKAIQEKLGAVWVLQEGALRCQAAVVEADGKTWLYLPASFPANNPKFTVKDGAGNPVTQLGQFQVAADAGIARWEITADAPTPFKLEAPATFGESPRFLVAIPGVGTNTPKLQDSSAESTNATTLELSSYGLADVEGAPVFDGQSGTLIALLTPPRAGAASLWEDPSNNSNTSRNTARATRLDRPIEWKTTTLAALSGEQKKIQTVNTWSKLLEAAASLTPGAAGLQSQAALPGGSGTVRQFLETHKSIPAVQQLLKLEESVASQKVRISEMDVKRQTSRILGDLASGSRRAAAELKAAKVSAAHREDAENALKWNDAADRKLAAKIAQTER